MSGSFAERQIRGVNLVLLSSGGEVHIDDISTAAQGQTVLDDIDGAIIAIEDQLATDRGRSDPVWRSKAEKALRRKRRQRPALQQRIGELRRAERQASAYPPAGPGPGRRDARRKAFIDAAKELLTPKVFTEVWARAEQQDPAAFDGRADA